MVNNIKGMNLFDILSPLWFYIVAHGMFILITSIYGILMYL